MTISGGIVIYFLWWWVVFLAVVPRNVQARWEAEDDGVEGADPGAPMSPQIGKKVWLTTKIATLFAVVTIAVIMSGVFNFRD
jgi:predicted secreted protein